MKVPVLNIDVVCIDRSTAFRVVSLAVTLEQQEKVRNYNASHVTRDSFDRTVGFKNLAVQE